jgi:hypothetical protein
VFIGMVLGGFFGVVCGMQPVPGGDMGMVRGLFVIASFMMSSSFAVMRRCVFVVFRRLRVVLGAFMFRHGVSSSCHVFEKSVRVNTRILVLTESRIEVYSACITA